MRDNFHGVAMESHGLFPLLKVAIRIQAGELPAKIRCPTVM